jgi:hypothetical protein
VAGGGLAGCVCLYEPKACWDIFVGFLKAVWEWIVANLPAIIGFLAIILMAVACYFTGGWGCLILSALISGISAALICLIDNNWPAPLEAVKKCWWAVLIAALGALIAGGGVAKPWHAPLRRFWDWWRKGRRPIDPGVPTPPRPPRDTLLAPS